MICPVCMEPMRLGVRHFCTSGSTSPVTTTVEYPAHVEHPVDAPTVNGTLVTTDTGARR